MSGLTTAARRVQRLVIAGEAAAAIRRLRAAPAERHPVDELVAAEGVSAYTLAMLNHHKTFLGGARWSAKTGRRLYREHDPRSLHAAHLLAVTNRPCAQQLLRVTDPAAA